MIDAETKAKWLRIKEALEEAGKTDSHFYRRALYILQGHRDPGPFSGPLDLL